MPIGLQFYITDGERSIFQFPQLRAERLEYYEMVVLGSVVFHAYVRGDYSNAEIEIADISKDPDYRPRKNAQREGRICLVPREEIIELASLSEEIDDVYAILRELIAKIPLKP